MASEQSPFRIERPMRSVECADSHLLFNSPRALPKVGGSARRQFVEPSLKIKRRCLSAIVRHITKTVLSGGTFDKNLSKVVGEDNVGKNFTT